MKICFKDWSRSSQNTVNRPFILGRQQHTGKCIRQFGGIYAHAGTS